MYLSAFVYVYAAVLTLVSFTVLSDPYNIDIYVKPGIGHVGDGYKTVGSAMFIVGSEGRRVISLAYGGFCRARRGPNRHVVAFVQKKVSPIQTLHSTSSKASAAHQILTHPTIPPPKISGSIRNTSSTRITRLPTTLPAPPPPQTSYVNARLLVVGTILLAAISLICVICFKPFLHWWRTRNVTNTKRTPSVEEKLGRFLAIRRRVGKINGDSETQNRAPPPSTPTKTQPRLSSPVQRAYRSPRTPRTKAQRQELSAMRRRVLLPVSEEAEILARRFPLVGRAPLEPMNINTDGGVYQIGSPVKGPLAG